MTKICRTSKDCWTPIPYDLISLDVSALRIKTRGRVACGHLRGGLNTRRPGNQNSPRTILPRISVSSPGSVPLTFAKCPECHALPPRASLSQSASLKSRSTCRETDRAAGLPFPRERSRQPRDPACFGGSSRGYTRSASRTGLCRSRRFARNLMM